MSVINTNIKALVAQDSMVKVNRSLSTAMERLSTGSRINTAADDAAGLSITTRMDSQVRGLSQAIRNANDGISIVQTSEGALEEVTSMLQRIRELSVQSINASNNADDRASIDAEVQQLKTEMNRVATTTQWNNMNLLDGTFRSKVLQVGDKANQTIDLNIESLKITDLGRGSGTGDKNTLVSARIGFSDTANALNDIAAGAILVNDTALRAFTAATDDLGDIIADINAKVVGVKASGFNVVVAEQVGSGVLANGDLAIKVRPLTTTGPMPAKTTFAISASTTLNELVNNINREVGGLVQASLTSDGKLQLSNETGADIEIDVTNANNSGFTADRVFKGFLKLESTTGDPVTVKRGSASIDMTQLAKLGLRETIKLDPRDANTIRGLSLAHANIAAAADTDRTGHVGTAWVTGDLAINGVDIFDASIATTSFQGKLNAINRFTAETGVVATGFLASQIGVTVNLDVTDRLTLNGVAVNTANFTNANLSTIVAAINTKTSTTGITATLVGTDATTGNIMLEGAVDSATLSLLKSDGTAATGTLVADISLGNSGAGQVGAAKSVTQFGGFQLDSVDNTPISIKLRSTAEADTTAGVNSTAFGFLEQNVGAADFDLNQTSIFPFAAQAVAKVNVLTAASASSAIGVVDKAIAQVSSVRSSLGALENRLEKTVNNLSNIVTNTAQSRSRIKDTDYAVETTNLAKAQIIQQAATAMLAQANQQPQSVLALLQ